MPATQQNLFAVFPWYQGEMDVFRKREPLTVSQWAERHRVVTDGANPGPWRNSLTPYLVEIMDTWGLPWVQEVVLCKSVQVGGTESMYNCLGYAIDRIPSSSMVVMPDEGVCKDTSKDRIRPMVESSDVLSELITADPDDLARFRFQFRNGAKLYMSWASSPSKLSSKPIKHLFLDEIEKFPRFAGKKESQEADPISLAEARTTTYPHTKKIFKLSTATTENYFIWPALLAAQEIRHYHVPCPECGQFQEMVFEQIKYPEGVDYKKIKRKSLAWYECIHCDAHWTDTDRNTAVRAGHWKAVELVGGHWKPVEPVERPQSVGFHLPAYYSPFVSLSEIAAKYLEAEEEAQSGNKGKLMHFSNSYKAEPYTDIQIERKEDAILALRDDRPEGLVPPDVSCLTATVDTQKRGFYYEIRAWGWGMALESWQIRAGYVDSFDALDEVLFNSEYKTAEGEVYIVSFALIDSGGTTGQEQGVSRTAEVYDYCRRSRRIFPLKGQLRKNKPWGTTPIDAYPGTGKPLPGGLKLYNINVTYYKDLLSQKLQISPGDPGAWHLHSQTSEQYAKHMCAEFKDDRGLWQCPRGKRNDFWDCGVYALAAAEIANIKFFKKPEPEDGKPKAKQQKPKRGRRW